MATPDPSTLTSSADIFSGGHTLPQIRAIHKSLHAAVDDKASRLRTQVGNSYRDLLGTADTIVQMRGDNERVQELLGGMGSRCGRTVVGAKVSGLADFVRRDNKDALQGAARVRLLDACALAVGRLLRGGGGADESATRGGGRLVLAAKVLVLSRLLVKSIDHEPSYKTLRGEVEAAKKALASLRQRLFNQVKKVLGAVTEDSDREDVVKALCAYSLATNSGTRDVLRHFMLVRSEAMAMALDAEPDQTRHTEDVILGLRLYTRSLLDVQAVVPAKLSQAMAELKSRPLLADPALKQLHGLRLDLYERWCGEEIQYFTPFIRHDDLDGKMARERLAGWAKEGGEILLKGLGATLAHMNEFKTIMDLRNSVLQLWIRDGGRVRGFDPTEMQDSLREVINARMLAVLQSKVDKLHIVGSEMGATLDSWKEGFTDKNRALWDDDGYEEALSRGAAPFVDEVVARLYGRNDAVSKASECYRTWFHVIDDVREVVASLTKQRWDNDFDEIEDEDTIEARQQALSKEDPELLQAKLDTALDKSFGELEKKLQSLWETKAQDPMAGAVAVYFVRVLRDIRTQLPDRPSTASFGLAMVPVLHETIVTSVARVPLEDFSKTSLAERAVIGRTLWEGEPALPTQPSPGLFGFLRNMSAAMGDIGMDLWSPTAVNAMRQTLDKQLSASWKDALSTLDSEGEKEEEADADADADADDASVTKKRDLRIQWLLDVVYLGHFLGEDRQGIKELTKTLRDKADTDDEAYSRISASAETYWRRTSLLFGLLA